MVASSEPVLYIPGPPRWSQAALVEELRSRLSQKVQRAFLFGSHARGSATADSDIDLILIVPTSAPSVSRPFEFIPFVQGLGAVDLLVYTPEEWEEMKQGGHSFLEEIQEEIVPVV
ncbi:MAG: nucleotidyltransferase domain-containing protein [Myxococcaceae bacterium]